MKIKLFLIITACILLASCKQAIITPDIGQMEIAVSRKLYLQWDIRQTYYAENIVSWKDQLWQTPYWSKGDEPGVALPWKVITEAEIPVDPLDPGYNLGETISVSPEQIENRWDGIELDFMPESVQNSIQGLMSEETYKELFPRRYGSPGWSDHSQKNDEEYYSYNNLINALIEMANIKLRIEIRDDSTRVFRLNKANLTETFLREDHSFNASWLINGPTKVFIVDYGKFVNEGSLEVKKRDLAAFLANISHETTGGWETAEGGPYVWGLYFNQEVGRNDDTIGGYSTGYHPVYPSNPNESYHGRGPIQLSWNYNYGYISQVLYNDKSILLNDPDRITHDGKLGFMTGIWFWMTPRSSKPSCHDVITGKWIPSQIDIEANRLQGFGTTINVINGSQEAGRPNDSRVIDRIGFYRKITAGFGIEPGENLDCFNQKPF